MKYSIQFQSEPTALKINLCNKSVASATHENWLKIHPKESLLFDVSKNSYFAFYENSEKGLKDTAIAVAGQIKKWETSYIEFHFDVTDNAATFTLNFLLAAYQFEAYKKEQKPAIHIYFPQLTVETLKETISIVEGIYSTRELVNQPSNYLYSTTFIQQINTIASKSGFTIKVIEKEALQQLQMGGILGVNLGSEHPPYLAILEYKNSENKPYVFVGKGVTYDTGGLSLKPTQNSMDVMKCDMAGAGTVVGLFEAIAKNQLPIHAIGLLPITDNRLNEKALSPGDVITMHDGTTVEVMDTDAEGRLILADALAYAKQYNPALVIDMATLTGAAIRAIGEDAIAIMHNTQNTFTKALQEATLQTEERYIEFPLWDDYKKQLDSDIADLKNLGGPTAGAITAGKFLEHFTDYPWMHLDIAGPAFYDRQKGIYPKGGTGFGILLLYRFMQNIIKQN